MEAVIGFVIAFAIGVTGIGAGTVTAPVLMLFMGVGPAVAVGTALVFATIVKVPAGISYVARNKADYPTLLLMVAGGVPGVVVGSLVLQNLSANKELKTLVLCIVGGIILLSAALNIVLMVRRVDLTRNDKLKYIIPAATFLIGMEVGFSSAGAGALGTLLLLFTTRLFACTVVGTDILFGLALSVVGGGIHLGLGNVDYPLLLKLTAGGIFGALAGVHFASRMPARPLRYALLAWLIFIGGQLLYRGITG